MPAVGANGPANGLNQVAQVAGRAAALTWTDSGNMATDGRGWTFTHDGFNRLTRAVNSGTGVTMAYAYDHANLRIESVRNPTGTKPDGTPAGGTRTRFLLSATEEVADIEVSATGTRTVTRRYVPGAAIDERLADINAQTGAVHFLHTDRQNSVVAISDAAGNPVARRGYGAYGETDPAQMTGAGAASHPFGYTGRRWDADLGVYYYRARWYDPQLGTFLQTDPIGAKDYINLYSYVGAEPGNATDPSGQKCVDNGTQISCTHDSPGVPRFTAPSQDRRADEMSREADGLSYHSTWYRFVVGTADQIDEAEALVTNNPTPGENDSPASPTGTLNDATPPWLAALGLNNPVRSFVADIGDTGRIAVINLTQENHALHEGYVIIWFTVSGNDLIMNVAGEGGAANQVLMDSIVSALGTAGYAEMGLLEYGTAPGLSESLFAVVAAQIRAGLH